jgi:hypothetical protein
MQFTLNDEEAAYLAHYVAQLAGIAARTKGAEAQARTAQKMRYKFAGKPTKIYLGGKERSLICEMLSYRGENLPATASDEALLIKEIVELLK